eukprot:958209-Prorocentrum_minimum.AAC.2
MPGGDEKENRPFESAKADATMSERARRKAGKQSREGRARPLVRTGARGDRPASCDHRLHRESAAGAPSRQVVRSPCREAHTF